jgi:hypothetical protein
MTLQRARAAPAPIDRRKTAPVAGPERSAGPAVITAVAQCTAAGPPLLRPGIPASRVPAAGAGGPAMG